MKNKLKKSTATLLVVCLVLSMFTGTALAMKFVFEDSIGHWAEDTIQKLSDKGLVAGYPDGLVHPDEIITRSEFVTLIANTLESETEVASATSVFTDIEGHWSEQDILLLIELEIILTDEYPNNEFEPDKAISRMEMVRMLTRALGTKHHSDDCICSLDFSDTDLLSEEDKMYLCIADKHYIICGYPDGSFKPEDDSTRAEAFEMIDNNEDAKDVIAETENDKDKDKEDDEDKDDNNRPSGGGGSSHSWELKDL